MTTENRNTLAVIDGETLMDMRLPPTKFCVDTVLPQGISILGGAPKIGKSWLVLDLCVRIAKGEPLWGLPTHKGTTLYLCLEDPLRRTQERLNCITDDVPPNAFFATAAGTLADGLCEQIKNFVAEHPDTVFVAIDTFQIVRKSSTDMTYSNDYEEIRILKQLADELGIALLLVHHLRKQGDSDPLNKLSGTTGISGAVDAIFVLDQSKRNATGATLICTGRDIEYRELELNLDKQTCVWELISDSLDEPLKCLPEDMILLVDLVKSIGFFSGGNTEFAERYNTFSGKQLSAKTLKQQMNLWRYLLEQNGVRFENHRSNGLRLVTVFFSILNLYNPM
ncbi:MAG: AAA family ATPase [Clostridia bacterium]|nr:AAA family ATPase [Clostridia bacterium]